jgi:anionic cell wall polymer biosynthesis LytR-Cps2A-Psr (LCP) family protein
MSGENALKYARSRHSTSDFDRSLRQQQVIDAIRNKLVSSYLITSPIKIKKLYDVFTEYVYTDIEL